MTKKQIIIWAIFIIFVLGAGGILTWRCWWVPREEIKEPEIAVPEEKVPALGELLGTSPEFKEFFEKTIKENPDLELDKFSKIETKSIEARILGKESPSMIKDNPVWVLSPDGSRALSILRYSEEPDSSLDIYNWNNDEKVVTLQFCGTPCEYWGVFWINNEQFVFIQSHEYFPPSGEVRCTVDTKCTYVLSISFYDLAKNTETVYQSQELEKQPEPPAWPEWDDRYSKYLPPDAELADVVERPLFYSDIDNDGKKEIVVAYYTIVPSVWPAGDEKFFLSIFDKIDDRFIEHWKREIEDGWRLTYLNVEDINKDGKIEIIFEEYVGASIGGQLYFFVWEDGEYKLSNYGFSWGTEIKDLNNDGVKEIIMVSRYNYYLPAVLRWNGKEYVYDSSAFPDYYKSLIADIKAKIPAKEENEYEHFVHSIALLKVYLYAGLSDEALKQGEELYRYFLQKEKPSPIGTYDKLADISATLGEVYQSKEMYEKAIEYYEEAMGYSKGVYYNYLAEVTLIYYFDLLSQEKYKEAVKYHGSGYEYINKMQFEQYKLDSSNPDNYAKILAFGCNFLVCEKVNITDIKQLSGDEFAFTVQFVEADGSLVKQFPYCCGEKPPPGAANTPKTEFEYRVKKVGDEFLVITPLLYIP